jgi:hypothetical protein
MARYPCNDGDEGDPCNGIMDNKSGGLVLFCCLKPANGLVNIQEASESINSVHAMSATSCPHTSSNF